MNSWIYTHNGDRPVNEDSAGKIDTDSGAFFIVCDGLGGHGKGDLASQCAVRCAKEKVEEMGANADEVLESAFLNAQNNLLDEQVKLDAVSEMKTTMVCLRIYDGLAQWGHVGDTRFYMFRKKKLFTRTLDHSVPQMLVASGEIKEKDIRFHEDRNRLIRVLGTSWDTPKYEIAEPVSIQEGDAFLMCTDGFWELLTEKDMIKCLKKSSSAQEWLERMTEIVNKNGKKVDMDNNTALGVII